MSSAHHCSRSGFVSSDDGNPSIELAFGGGQRLGASTTWRPSGNTASTASYVCVIAATT